MTNLNDAMRRCIAAYKDLPVLDEPEDAMSDDKVCPRCHQSTEPGWIDERVPKLEARVRELEAELEAVNKSWRTLRVNGQRVGDIVRERDALRALLRDAGYALPSGLLRDRIDAALKGSP